LRGGQGSSPLGVGGLPRTINHRKDNVMPNQGLGVEIIVPQQVIDAVRADNMGRTQGTVWKEGITIPPKDSEESRAVAKAELKDYINMLLGATGRIYTPEAIEELLALGSRQEINRAILSAPPAPRAAIPDAVDLSLICEKFAQKQDEDRQSALKNFKSQVKSRLSDAEYYYAEYMRFLGQLVQDRQKLDLTLGLILDLRKTVECILMDQSLTLVEASDNCIVFLTSDCVVNYKHPELQIDMTVNFGKFKLSWNPLNGLISVSPGGNNTKSRYGFYHPHLSGFSICMGNAKQSYADAIANGRVAEAVQLIKAVLCSYNSSSPYETFQQFFYIQKRDLIDLSKDPTYMDEEFTAYLKESELTISPKVLAMGFLANDRIYLSRQIGVENQSLVKVQVYTKMSTPKKVPVDNYLYVRSMNGKYCQIESEKFYGKPASWD